LTFGRGFASLPPANDLLRVVVRFMFNQGGKDGETLIFRLDRFA
jgi:hypothetical protein